MADHIYPGDIKRAQEYEANGDYLAAAQEYLMYYQYFEDSDFPFGMDAETARMALSKSRELQRKLNYAYLSKTTYIKGCQCLRALWLYKNRYNLRRVSQETQDKFKRGHLIGELAQKLFLDGQDASLMISQLGLKLPFKIKQNTWLQTTNELIRHQIQHIYEAAFTYNDVFAAIDVLESCDGRAVGYEVKSSFDIKDVYIQDCALQYYVISHSLALDELFLIYPDEEYINSLGIDIDELNESNCEVKRLFKMKPILEEVKALQPDVEKNLKIIKPILNSANEPRIPMGEQCNSPYECEFQKYCSGRLDPYLY